MSTKPISLYVILVVAMIAIVAGLLAGCGSTAPEDWTAVPPRREPRVETLQYAHEVVFAGGESRISPAEHERLAAFLHRLDVGDGDTVHVVGGDPDPAADSRNGRLGERRREAVTAVLRLVRLAPEPLLTDFAARPGTPSAIAVLVRRRVVTLPGCPDWSGRPGRNFENQVSSNFGCATAINFGLMVADPRDLERGRRTEPVDARYGVLAIERYHKGETKPLAVEDTGSLPGGGQKQPSASGGAGAN